MSRFPVLFRIPVFYVTKPVTRDIETSFRTFKKFTPFDDQKGAMSASFLYTSYGITWLGEKAHPFMTKKLIAIPFKPASYGEGLDHSLRSQPWTAQTRVYQTELACAPAEIEASRGTEYKFSTYKFSTDKCTYTTNPLYNPNGTRNMMYIGFAHGNGLTDDYLREEECKDPNLFLAIWAKSRSPHNRSDELDLNALYCKPSYYYQTHEVTVDGADGSILEADPLGKRTNFTQGDKIIDIILFEGNLGAASTVDRVYTKYFASEAPNSMLGFEDWGLDNPTGQITYVIGLSLGKKFGDFKDPVTFRNGLERMHQLLFNNALWSLLVPGSSGEVCVGNSAGIVVVPLIAHILASFLGLVVVCLCGVFFVSHNRQNNLASDPDTLGTKMALVAQSKMLLRDFDGTNECPAPHLCMEPRKYKLGTWGGEGGYRLDVIGGKDNALVQNPHASCTVPHDVKLVSPIGLSIWTGLTVTFVNIALLTLLIVLYKSSLR